MSKAIADAFERFQRFIVRIQTASETGRRTVGTGVIVGSTRPGRHVYIATATHVVPKNAVTDRTRVSISRDLYPERVLEWDIVPGQKVQGIGYSYDAQKGADAALLRVPGKTDMGNDFLDPEEDGIPVGAGNVAPGPSTRVAWAGYPNFLTDSAVLGRALLCYFEGSVSALVNEQEMQILVIDGHAMPGVSGGPVWWQNELNGRVEVIGVISRYAALKTPTTFHPNLDTDDDPNQRRDRMPGLCFVQPLHNIFAFMASFAKTRDTAS